MICMTLRGKKKIFCFFLENYGDDADQHLADMPQRNSVQDLLKFTPAGSDSPLVSEAFLYDAIGKEEARTFLVLLQKVIDQIDPSVRI